MDSYAVCRPVNRVLLTFLLDVLEPLDHLTKAFQLINSSIVHCLEIVEDVRLDLENFKAEDTSEHIASLLADGSTEPVGSQPSSKRQRRLPGYLTNSVDTTRLPQYRDSDTISKLRALIVDIIEGFKNELDGRFSSSNVGIWDSFQSLSPQFDKDKFLDKQRLDKLLVYAMNVPALKSPSGSDARRSIFLQPAAACPKWHRRGGVRRRGS